MKLILCGNSHLAYFWQEIKKYEATLKTYDIKFACTNFLKEGLDYNNKDSFLKKFRYNDSVSYGDKTIPNPQMFEDFILGENEKAKVIMVGMGLKGEAVYGNWGGFNSCKLPLCTENISTMLCNKDNYEPISKGLLGQIYHDYYVEKSTFLQNINDSKNIEVLAWFASPNLNREAAKYCFGEKQLKSGNPALHYEIQEDSYNLVFKESGHSELMIDPNLDLCDDNYLLNDKYKLSATNNHATPEFYAEGIKNLLDSNF
ncbi:hypothetical protein [Aliiglaciecola sp. NS0011-25]|uniref:hypothetical protein n=1 Tax=Aliiglaciecola sp. NS0011-25 TaxID=3127654 RepID=UPI00310BF777